MNDQTSSTRLATLSRGVRIGDTSEETLSYVVGAAVDLIAPCETASITLASTSKKVESAATSSARALRNDEIQAELGDGPCVQAALREQMVEIPDLREERRWPGWAARAHEELGFGSGVCIRLFHHDRGMGALNLFASRPAAFDDDDVNEAVALAAHAAVALAAAENIENLQFAVTNRTIIGQATGMVMVQYGLTSLQAFDVLKRLSSEQNRKLSLVARDLVTEWNEHPKRPSTGR